MNRQILQEAAERFVHVRDAMDDASAHAELAQWLSKSPEHVRAYLEIAEIWADVAAVGATNTPDAATLIAQARAFDEVIALDGVSARRSPRPARGRATRFALAASLLLVCLLAVTARWQAVRFPTYETETGEQRSITLADGSIVELNARSRLRVNYSAREREVELLEGQGLFRVAKDPQRPFVVRSDEVRVRAVGTQFDVYRKAGGTIVTVLEGKVEVSTPAASASAPRMDGGNSSPASTAHAAALQLVAGQQVQVEASGIAAPTPANLEAATAWTQRQIAFDSAPLAQVAQEFNRYNFKQLVVADASLDGVLITGVFSSSDASSLLRFLREQPDLRVEETETEIRITARR